MIAAIVLTSGSDTQDATDELGSIGGIAFYDEDCRFSGTPIAVLHAFERQATGTIVTTRPNDEFVIANVGGVGLAARIRTVSGADALSELAHDADFTGDGLKDDVIPTDDLHVGFFSGAVPAAGANNVNLPGVSNIAIAEDDWDGLNIDTDATGNNAFTNNNNRVQLFVNRARDCWSFRRV